MAEYSFSTKAGKSYYHNNIRDFISEKSDTVLGQLVRVSFETNSKQIEAWENEISELQKRLQDNGVDGDIILEYDILRLNKRIDVVLLISHMVFSLEFKNGKTSFEAKDAQQAEDYATDIKNFHKESEHLYVCPILIATRAKNVCMEQSIACYPDKQIALQKENIETLMPKIKKISDKYGSNEKLDFNKWFNSPYYPTPTIIAAAIQAYETKDITSIAKSEAGQENINKCEEELEKIIAFAKKENKKVACFVTGVPGAGKTLVGLDVVAKSLAKDSDTRSVYLSGNGPLVEVLQTAIVNSAREKNINKKETKPAVSVLIQSSYAFKRDSSKRTEPNPEHIVVFDEAQRCRDETKMKKAHNDDMMHVSEPYLFYKIMDRHKDWAVLICLVGLGQDIYDGENGINEWFKCVIDNFTNWDLYYSDKIFTSVKDNRIEEDKIKSCPRCHVNNALHLSTSIRSFRSDKQAEFVNALINGDHTRASELLNLIFEKYPIYITRDINEAKKWAKSQIRGSQRCGIIASSGAQRLRAEGIYVPTDIDVKNWFLAPPSDVRSSNMMEVVASEFKVQGLEVDWAIVCWDIDLRRNNDNWAFYKFNKGKRERRLAENSQRYLLNAYRVLLTRARQGMVIFLPNGCDKSIDPSRDGNEYSKVYEYLISCGIRDLPLETKID